MDQENNTLSVWNNGSGIPVVVHKEHGCYVPELIFGNLLTGASVSAPRVMRARGSLAPTCLSHPRLTHHPSPRPGSNFDDGMKKTTGGRNGYGAKLANIFSTRFTIETADKASGKKYRQTFRDNMTVRGRTIVEL